MYGVWRQAEWLESSCNFLIFPRSCAVGARRPLRWKYVATSGRGQNQSHHALEQEVIPRPIDQHKKAVAKANQFDEVNTQPREPRREAGKCPALKMRNSSVATNGGHHATIAIAESNRHLPGLAPLNVFRGDHALLQSVGRDHGKRLAVLLR